MIPVGNDLTSNTANSLIVSPENYEDLTGEIDEACYDDKPDKSSDDEDYSLNAENPENTNNNADLKKTPLQLIENTTPDNKVETAVQTEVENTSAQINVANTTSDNEISSCDKAIAKSTTDKVNVDNTNITSKDNSETAKVYLNTDKSLDTSEENKKYIINKLFKKFVPIQENEDPVKIVDLSNKMSKVYDVNGAMFVEEDIISQYDNEDLEQYEVYQMDVGDEDDDDMITPLEMHIQRLSEGVIINSNVFLGDIQWNTMTFVDGHLFHCAICQVYCDRVNCDDHVKTKIHRNNLDKYTPLKRFDLSIVRKINENLHCGVCNEIFDIIDCEIHENSKSHEENLLTAINKVSDKDIQIHSYRDTSSSDRRTSSSDRRTSSYDRIMASTRNVSTPEWNDGEYHFDANAINNVNVSEDLDEYSDDGEDHFGEMDEINDDFYEVEQYHTPREGVSYASMASKPSIKLPKQYNIDSGSAKVPVTFDHWNMINRLLDEPNKFYCQVCKIKDHIKFKSQHCISCEHVEKLAQCPIIRAFKDYLIRKVDDKLFHCSHKSCNKLQYHDQMVEHIELAHPKINRNLVETSNPVKTAKRTKTVKKTKTVIEPKKPESDKTAIINKNIENDRPIGFGEPKIDPNFDIFGNIPLTPFGCPLIIPALNFNLIMKKDDCYYCAICDKACADVKVHVEEMGHIELMTMAPFIKPFQNNLTRAVRGMLHCSLCNILFPVSVVYDHNIDQPHTTALAAAMGMMKSQKPVNTKRVTILNLEDQNNSQNSAQNRLQFNLPMQHQNKGLNLQNQKENIKSVSDNVLIDRVTPNENIKGPEVVQNSTLSHLGKNGAVQTVFDAASVIARINTEAPQNRQCTEQGLMNLLKVGQNQPNSGQNLPKTGQNLPQAGHHNQNLPSPAQNLPNSGQNLPTSGQNLLTPGQNLPTFGQNFPFPPNLTPHAVKSIPPMFNTMFPTLPPVNSQVLQNQFMGAPLVYNYNTPRPTVSPFPNNVITHNQTNNYQNYQETQRQKIIVTDRKGSVSGTESSKSGSDNTRPDSDNTRPIRRNARRDSDNSKCSNDNFKSGSDNTRPDSDNTRPIRRNARRDSVNSKCSSDNFKFGSDHSKSVNDIDYNMEIDSLSDDDEFKEFDEEEMVFLKLKTTYFKITNMSFNTLVFLDNGIRYCFVCSTVVPTSQQRKHVASRKHMDCLAKNKFIDKYGVQLFRQMYLMYHCAVCNELMTRKEIKLHLDWVGHVDGYNMAYLVLNKKNRKELKSGLKEYIAETQKESIYTNVNEPHYHVRAAYQIVPSLDVKKDAQESRPAKSSSAVKKNKMVIQNNVVMKISFDHWHGITTAKNVTKCVICQVEITPEKVIEHVETEYHAVALGKTFEKSYYPALVRKINEQTVNCMTCNLELPNADDMIHEHVSGRKHSKNHSGIVNETSNSDSYADCYEDYLNL